MPRARSEPIPRNRCDGALSAAGARFQQLAGSASAGRRAGGYLTKARFLKTQRSRRRIQAAIAAAAIAALGNHARVWSARTIPSSDVVSPWTQQGRVIVQSSHNLRTQGSR